MNDAHVTGKTQNRRGRPLKAEADKKRHNQTVRIRGLTRQRLEAAARESERSISEEIESRVDRTFELENSLGSPSGAKFLNFVSDALREIQEAIKSARGGDWSDSVYARIMLEEAIKIALDHFKPVPVIHPRGLLAPADDERDAEVEARRMAADVGRGIADRLILRNSLAVIFTALENLESLSTDEQRSKISEAKAKIAKSAEDLADPKRG